VKARLDHRTYTRGVKVTEKEMQSLKLTLPAITFMANGTTRLNESAAWHNCLVYSFIVPYHFAETRRARRRAAIRRWYLRISERVRSR